MKIFYESLKISLLLVILCVVVITGVTPEVVNVDEQFLVEFMQGLFIAITVFTIGMGISAHLMIRVFPEFFGFKPINKREPVKEEKEEPMVEEEIQKETKPE